LRKSGTSALLLLFCACAASAAPATRERETPVLLVLAAASLTDVLGDLSPGWERRAGVGIRLSFASSAVLARQIEAGGNADVFVSADREWMDFLQSRGRLDEPSRRDLVGNRLVLIAPADSRVNLTIARGFPLLAALRGGRLSTGDPDTVPVGRYARAALTSLGVWNEVANHLVRADNVRSAMMFVARGEAPLGIVYATDARMDRKVRVVDTFPPGTHDPITYPAAAIRGARPEATAYLAYLAGSEAAPVWRRYGFLELPD
jgi:molybdate transport system substrate-binding protein